MFVHVVSAPLNLTGLAKLLYHAEIVVLTKFSVYEATTSSEFFLLRVRQLQGHVISSYYKRDRDSRALLEFLEPSMPLLRAAKTAPDSEVGKMSLFMAAVALCLGDLAKAESYVGAAKARGVTIKEAIAPLEKCQ